MNKKRVAVVDYGMGNLFNIQRVLNSLGVDAMITSDQDDIKNADRLIIPGVGAFDQAMNNLRSKQLIEPICDFAKTGKPLLGICLGMQLLFSESVEFGLHKGLNLIKGSVLKFDYTKQDDMKIPQIGWNTIKYYTDKSYKLLHDLPDNSYFYFIHSYYCKPDDKEHIVATTEYSGPDFCSITNRENIWGCQFHPERSADNGLIIFKNFINL